MKLSIVEYIVIFLAILIGVLALYKLLQLIFAFFRIIYYKISDRSSSKKAPKVPIANKRKIERREKDRRTFNRGFYVRKGFFDKELPPEEFGDQDYIDRRKGERRKDERRSK